MRKNNLLYYLMVTTLSSVAITACQSEDTLDEAGETSLSLAPSIEEMGNQESVTRTTAANFFAKGDKISVDITTNRTTNANSVTTYTLDANGIFTGDFRFNLDNTYITQLDARWPNDEVRKNEGIKLDQRILEDFQKADRLKAHTKTVNIMPTAEPVPITFEHEQSRFTFRMAGQNANGLNIQEIILELQHDLNSDGQKESCAFWAYCNNTEEASLILVPGIELKGGSNGGDYTIVNKRYMIGMATVGNAQTQYRGGIWLDENIALTLKPNTDYLVTLTPEGYDLYATISIHGFGQNEGYIGVPSKPKSNN